MIDQEKRGKAIEEMAKVLCRSTMLCNECLKADSITCDALQLVTRLYDAGYRKGEEVQKKTAGNILTEFYFTIFHMYDEDDAEMIERLVKNLSEQYCARYRND